MWKYNYIRIGGPGTWSRNTGLSLYAATSKSSNRLRSPTLCWNLPSWKSGDSSSTRCWRTRPTTSRWMTGPSSVTTKEVLDFYLAEYGLKETDIEQYAAAYTARIKVYRECTRWLDPALVRRLLDEEYSMKPCESDSFRLRLRFDWLARRKALYPLQICSIRSLSG